MLTAQTEAEELPTVSVNPYFTFGPVTKAVSEMKQHLNEFSNDELVRVAKAGEFKNTENLKSEFKYSAISSNLWYHYAHVINMLPLLPC